MLQSRRSLLAAALGLAAIPLRAAGGTRAQPGMFAESESYERFMGRWSRQLAPLLVEFAGLRAGRDILDVGSGTGALASAVAKAVPTAHIVGVDPSPAYVGYAQAHAGGARLRFVVGDAQNLEFGDAAFDHSLSLLVMNFIPDPAKALKEMIRVTRPGGTIAAAVWDYGGGMQLLRVFWDEAVARDRAAADRDERNMPLCRQGELATLWQARGLARVQESSLDVPLSFTSFDDYWKPFLGGQGPAGSYTMSLTPEGRAALERRLRSRLLADGPDRPFTLHARAWAVKGTVPAR